MSRQQVNVIGGAKDESKLTDGNIGVVSDGKGNLTVKLSKDLNLTDAGSIKIGNTTINNGSIGGLAGNLPDTYNKDALNPESKDVTTNASLPNNAQDIVNNAATVGDVLNAGWNLQNNSEARDFVKAYDTVNFVNGTGTVAKVVTDANGQVSNVTFDVNLKDANTIGNITNNANGTASVPTGENAGDKLANVTTVVNAINNSGWNVTVGSDKADFEDQAGKGEQLVKPGEKVVLQSGKNLKVKQDNQNITFALEENIQLESVLAGKPGENGKDGLIGVAGKDGNVIVLDGKTGTVTAQGTDGSIAGLDGSNGTLLLQNGKEGPAASIGVVEGPAGLNGNDGKDGKTKTRIREITSSTKIGSHLPSEVLDPEAAKTPLCQDHSMESLCSSSGPTPPCHLIDLSNNSY